ncbi:unnamed protein product [Schistocephalus solidus]|uniref:RNase_PH domain-containing protein n=1 Tax=Schistocephalus solidus TaxID=70667 RepID=A0A183T627_SCHSO|nr:unnamed protein product [Schistocephalus solidus]
MLSAEPECSTLTNMFLSGVRLDGRTLKEYREITFHFPHGHANGGCCIVKIGSTAVLAKVSVEVVEPKHYRPAQGMLFVNFDATILSANEVKRKGRSRDDEGRRLSAVLQTCFRDCVDLDALCIVAWERVFAIRVDLRALASDGNLGDCGALAAVVALASFRRPDVYVGDEGRVIVDTQCKHRPPVPLFLRRIPVLVTLGLASDTKIILQDPTKREEAILTGGRVMVGLTSHGELCCLHTSGLSTPIRPESLSRCILLANSRARSLVTLVHRVLDGLERQRQARQAASSARQADVERAKQMEEDAPLVLSSASFLPGGDNAPMGELALEEGELGPLSADESDMDISNGSEEEVEGITPAAPRDPYGVIELSSLAPEENQSNDHATQYGSRVVDWSSLPCLESDAAVMSHNLPGGRKRAARSIHQLEKSAVSRRVEEEDEEESTALVHLL